MKAIGIIGSPRRNGNVETLVNAALDGAKKAGMETAVYHLGDMDIKGCSACNRCKKEGVCRYDDDVWKLLMAMQDADAVVFGSPIYYWQLSSQMRAVLDRSYAFLRPDFTTSWKPGKKAIVITSQGQPDVKLFDKVSLDLTQILETFAGFKVVDRIVMSGGNDPSAARSRPELLERARTAGEKLGSP